MWLPGSSPCSTASGDVLQFVDQLAGLSDAQVFGVVDAVPLLEGDGEVEALAIGDRVQCPHLAGGGLAAVGAGFAVAITIRCGMTVRVAVGVSVAIRRDMPVAAGGVLGPLLASKLVFDGLAQAA